MLDFASGPLPDSTNSDSLPSAPRIVNPASLASITSGSGIGGRGSYLDASGSYVFDGANQAESGNVPDSKRNVLSLGNPNSWERIADRNPMGDHPMGDQPQAQGNRFRNLEENYFGNHHDEENRNLNPKYDQVTSRSDQVYHSDAYWQAKARTELEHAKEKWQTEILLSPSVQGKPHSKGFEAGF